MELIQQFDDSILYYIYENWHNAFTDGLFITVSRIADCGLIWFVLAGIMLLKKDWRSTGIVMLFALGLGALVGTVILKNIICRERPFNVDETLQLISVMPGGQYSFPSGHSNAAGACSTVIFLRDKRFGTAAVVYALMVAFSRVFLVVHYPTDVICGLLLGGACAIIMWKVMYKFTENTLEKIYLKRSRKA